MYVLKSLKTHDSWTYLTPGSISRPRKYMTSHIFGWPGDHYVGVSFNNTLMILALGFLILGNSSIKT